MTYSPPTFLFYDLETTGLSKCFDQIVQFAAIRTDMQLHEISRHEIYIRLNPDVIPSPQAMITHRIPLTTIMEGESELNAIKKIHQLMNTPGTISIGYNTLNFDDEFLRFSFYRNLLPPYTHQYAHNCRRMDLYPLTIMYYLYKPEALVWRKINDKVSLKLESLNSTNMLAAGQAHNAMVDVEATVSLAKQLMKHEDMWKYLTGYFDKNTDARRMQKLPIYLATDDRHFQEAIMIYSNIGAKLNYQAPAICLGNHHYYRNQTLWLRLDHENLDQTTADTIATNTIIYRKKLAENLILLPPHSCFFSKLNSEQTDMCDKNKIWLQKNKKLFNLICEYHQNYTYPKIPQLDNGAALYAIDFASPHDEFLANQFYHTKPKEMAKLANQFQHPTRRDLAIRLLGRHFPEELDKAQRDIFNGYLQQINSTDISKNPIDYQNQRHLTPHLALQQIADLLEKGECDPQQIKILTELKHYIASTVNST